MDYQRLNVDLIGGYKPVQVGDDIDVFCSDGTHERMNIIFTTDLYIYTRRRGFWPIVTFCKDGTAMSNKSWPAKLPGDPDITVVGILRVYRDNNLLHGVEPSWEVVPHNKDCWVVRTTKWIQPGTFLLSSGFQSRQNAEDLCNKLNVELNTPTHHVAERTND